MSGHSRWIAVAVIVAAGLLGMLVWIVLTDGDDPVASSSPAASGEASPRAPTRSEEAPNDATKDGAPEDDDAANDTTADDGETTPEDDVQGDRGPASDAVCYRHDVTRAAAALAEATGEERALVEKIASTPQAFWLAGADPAAAAASARDVTEKAAAEGTIGVLVIYAAPGRDCGQHSSGGVGESAYARWIDGVADALVGEPWIVLEPDALAMLGDCDGQGDRVGYLQYAAEAFAQAGARVYIDVGHSDWLSAEEAARRLELIGLDDAVGFALNVSNYQTTADSVAYGERISALTGGARYVIDTSRNGNGSDGTWCNPPGRALGERPHLVDDDSHLDAALWIKLPGESDGTCHGGPAAGQWFHEIALELARNAAW